MAIIGILAGITAGAVTGLGGQGINAQIASDTNAIETAADRFLNDTFPETFPVEALASGEEDLGVRTIDFDAALPQDPTKTFVPDFLKKIPDSAALVSYRIDTVTGRVFTADDGATLVPPPDSRLDASFSDLSPSGNPVVTFELNMGKNRAAVEELRIQGPGGFVLGGRALPAGSKVGKLEITFGNDNPWRSGHEISVDTDLIATGRAHEWEMTVDYTSATSDSDNSSVTGVREGVGTLTHSFTISASGDLGVPGKIFLVMDRTGLTKFQNEATETWVLTIFDKAQDSAGVVIVPEERLITNPSVSKVYRWLTEEHSTVQVEDIFVPVAGRLSIVIKVVVSPTATPSPSPTPAPTPTATPPPTPTPAPLTLVQTIDGTQGGGIAFLNVVDVAVDAGNNIRVIETDIVTFDGRLRSFDTNGDPISPTVTLDQPKSVAIDSSGKSVVVEGFTFTIATRNLDGALDSSFPTTGNSLSVAVGQDGNYLVGQSPVRVRQFSPLAGTLLQTIGASDFTGSSVDAVAVDPTTGRFYAADSTGGADRVLLFNANGTFNSVFVTGIPQPLGLAVDASGNVYVSQTITGPRIRIFQPNKFELDSIVTDISNPRGIAIDNDGRIIVADGPVVKICSKLP